MPRKLTWTDSEDIGILLHERFPQVDPLTVRFSDLHRQRALERSHCLDLDGGSGFQPQGSQMPQQGDIPLRHAQYPCLFSCR